MDFEMRMPDLSTVDDMVTVVAWLVEVGQAVRRGQPILEVETDKAILQVESIVTGTLMAIGVSAGEEVSSGQVIARFEVHEEATASPAGQPVPAPTMRAARVPHSAVDVPTVLAPGAVDKTGHEARLSADRVSFLARNRQARAAVSSPVTADQYSGEFLLSLHGRMVLIREFEEGVKFLFLEGAMPGTIHQCQGQEATAVGVCAALEESDFITSTFRGHGHALAKGLSVDELLFELFGAATGCCGGKGGSMHVGNMARGMVPGIAIVAGGIPLAAGMALAFKMQKSRQIVACFFGDGAVAEGAFHEGVNLAAIWDLPVLLVCENNLYGASTRLDGVMRNPRIADRAVGYGIDGHQVDGNDVLAVYEAARAAAESCRRGGGPVLLELLTYRRTGHSRRDACQYQPEAERSEWFGRDPIDCLERLLRERGLAGQAELDAVREQVQADFRTAVEAARGQPLPAPEDLTTDVFA
jgi:pyruvate dehydrogenase E1 component alpha subunit